MPARLTDNDEKSTRPTDPLPRVDSQRVYSALMKRSLRNQQSAQTLGPSTRNNKDLSAGVLPEPYTICTYSPSATIRRVRQEDDVFHVNNVAQRGDAQHHEPITGNLSMGINDIYSPVHPGFASSVASSSKSKSSINKHSKEHSSAFFGSPSSHLFRTTSPYRRALKERIEESRAPESVVDRCGKYLGSLANLSPLARPASVIDLERHTLPSCSSSVYSSETNETPKQSEPNYEVFKLASRQPGNSSSSVRRNGDGETSAMSYLGQPNRLNANGLKMEDKTVPEVSKHNVHLVPPTPTRRHVREAAQIESPKEALSPFPGPSLTKEANCPEYSSDANLGGISFCGEAQRLETKASSPYNIDLSPIKCPQSSLSLKLKSNTCDQISPMSTKLLALRENQSPSRIPRVRLSSPRSSAPTSPSKARLQRRQPFGNENQSRTVDQAHKYNASSPKYSVTNERLGPKSLGHADYDQNKGIHLQLTTGLIGQGNENIRSTGGSQGMVDKFLASRRSMAFRSSTASEGSSTPAFL